MEIGAFFKQFSGHSLTYEDLIFLPGLIDFPLEKVRTSTWLTRTLRLKCPVVSSPMDTVTEADLAIALALQGGIGLVHYNMSPKEQQQQVEKVKRFKNGVVFDPMTLGPQAHIQDVLRIRQEFGYSIVPITEKGHPHDRLLGMVTKYDYSPFTAEDLAEEVKSRMIPLEKLSVATYEELASEGSVDLALANQRLLDTHSAALPIVDKEGNLRCLITRSDLDKHQNFPDASVDSNGALLVGAAVETWQEKAEERLYLLHNLIDVVVFDTSQGHSKYEIELIQWVKQTYPHLQIIAGNVVTKEAAEALINAGADAIRVGMGSGSICTTQEVGGIGRGQASAVYHCGEVCRHAGIPLIADGGISKSADIVKAFCLGASTVMLGSLLACTDEAPGQSQIKDGIRFKKYRGMGSLAAMAEGGAARYGIRQELRMPEGVEGMVPSKGRIAEWVPTLMQGVRQGLHKLGHPSLQELQKRINSGGVFVERRSEGAKAEGRIHDLYEVSAQRVSTPPKHHTPSRELSYKGVN